jgi:hypothetical protein
VSETTELAMPVNEIGIDTYNENRREGIALSLPRED